MHVKPLHLCLIGAQEVLAPGVREGKIFRCTIMPLDQSGCSRGWGLYSAEPRMSVAREDTQSM